MNSKLIAATKQFYQQRQQPLKEAFGLTNYEYQMPEDPKEKLYDFYFFLTAFSVSLMAC